MFKECEILNIQHTITSDFYLLLKMDLLNMLNEHCMKLVGSPINVLRILPFPIQKKWGWILVNGQYFPKWPNIQNPIDALAVTSTFSCVSSTGTDARCNTTAGYRTILTITLTTNATFAAAALHHLN